MKKVVFTVITFFALFVISDTILANTDTEYDTALKYYNSGKYDEAVRLLKDYIKKKPEASAYYRIGYALYKLGRYDEANKYFKDAYLIDPMFSPGPIGPIQKYPEEKIKEIIEPSGEQAPSKQIPPIAESKEKQPLKEIQPQETQEPAVTSEKELPQPEPQEIETQGRIQPPAGFPPFRIPEKGPPPGLLTGLFAGFAMILLILEIALYVFFCLCMFLIAKKLNVPAPWIAWIPLVQVWTVVSSAGKPWWWILLLLIPVVNIIVAIYLWICITENLGRNKWLGLLMLLPIINLVFLGILAFSKTEKLGYTREGATPA